MGMGFSKIVRVLILLVLEWVNLVLMLIEIGTKHCDF
jgi:hypothetical protein